MATSKNAKKRQQAQRAQQRRTAAATPGAGTAGKTGKVDKAVAKAVADEFPPASTTPIEPTGGGSISTSPAVEEDDGPGFTTVRRGPANTVIVALVVVAMVVALLVLVVR